MRVYKTNRLLYYLKGYLRPLIPAASFDKKIHELSGKLSREDMKSVEFRVDYYCKFSTQTMLKGNQTIQDLKTPVSPKSYYFDTYEYARYFDHSRLIDYTFGDVNVQLDHPAITKSRPVVSGNNNNILLKLDKVRHFVRVEDTKPYKAKKDLLVGRGNITQPHRVKFYRLYYDHPLCDLGQTNRDGNNPQWIKPKMPLEDHLNYKFILSLEGNDVATNLKWIMSSNSAAVAINPKIESWYMEGTLLPNVHYIAIKDDYSDLPTQLQYYIDHPKEAREIIENAKVYRSQFDNRARESLISLLVLKKYLSSF
ncbi:glycosyl transferase family 90 [Ravibacter arvi]|uniref:Glycosyl transferase family 90 n=1 Tax=Ravibacter arvi TaxID=2051041 RepID=A0ABP8LY24_9BACT